MKLFSRISGSGIPLVILHGLYGSSDNWLSIIRQLEPFAQIHALDARNHGQSPHTSEHNYPAMGIDIHEYFTDNQIDKAILLGHSMGGKAAMYFSLQWPEKVHKLIVADISPRTYAIPEQAHSPEISHKKILETLISLNVEQAGSRAEIDAKLAAHIPIEKIRMFLLKNLRRNPNRCLGEAGCFEWQINLKALYSELERIMEGFELLPVDACQIPTLFLRGDQSPYISESDLPLIKKLFPVSNITTLHGAGHWLHADKPELFVSEVIRFINL